MTRVQCVSLDRLDCMWMRWLSKAHCAALSNKINATAADAATARELSCWVNASLKKRPAGPAGLRNSAMADPSDRVSPLRPFCSGSTDPL